MGVPSSPAQMVTGAKDSADSSQPKSWAEMPDFVLSMLAAAGGPAAARGLAATCKAQYQAVDKAWADLTQRFPLNIYVVGGLDLGFIPVTTAWRLSGAAWEALPPLPAARAGPAAVLLEGQLYVLGGELCGDAVSDVQRFNQSACRWEAVAPMHQARIRPGVAVSGGFIYVFGGLDGANALQSAERFNPRTGIWEELPAMHRPRYACAGSACAGEGVLAFAGELTEQGAAASLEIFSPQSNTWELLPSVRNPACGSAVGLIGAGRLGFAVGGLGLSGQALPSAEGLPLGQAIQTGSARFQGPAWVGLPPMPTPRHLASVAGYGNRAVVVAGKGPTFEATTFVDAFDPEAGAWESLPPLPDARLRAAVVCGR